jgi:hypothetical protein
MKLGGCYHWGAVLVRGTSFAGDDKLTAFVALEAEMLACGKFGDTHLTCPSATPGFMSMLSILRGGQEGL